MSSSGLASSTMKLARLPTASVPRSAETHELRRPRRGGDDRLRRREAELHPARQLHVFARSERRGPAGCRCRCRARAAAGRDASAGSSAPSAPHVRPLSAMADRSLAPAASAPSSRGCLATTAEAAPARRMDRACTLPSDRRDRSPSPSTVSSHAAARGIPRPAAPLHHVHEHVGAGPHTAFWSASWIACACTMILRLCASSTMAM